MAADAAVSFLLENLRELIIREADLLIGVNEKVEWIDTEFQLMAAHLESVDALHQIPKNANDCMEATRAVVRRAEILIETYAKRVTQSKMAPIYKRPIYWFEISNLAHELERIEDEIIQVRKRWKSVDFANPDFDSHQVSLESDSIRKLDDIRTSNGGNYFHGSLLERIKWVRDELVPLHNFLLEIDQVSVELLSERQRVWIQELRNIFQFLDESFASLESSSFFGSCTGLESQKFREAISKIQNKILKLYRSYIVYGFGEIQVNNDGPSRSIFPVIRMDTAPRSYTIDIAGHDTIQLMRYILFFGFEERKIESFKLDVDLMNALLDDARSMGYVDKRVRVWLDQMHKISNDLNKLNSYSSDNSQGKNGLFGHIFGPSKIANKLSLIGHEIRDIAARKRRYGIDIAMGEADKSLSFTAAQDSSHSTKDPVKQFINFLKPVVCKDKFRRQVESVELELQLMQAFLEDVNKMEKLDARLKIWVEEMKGVEREAMAVLEHKSANNPYERFQAVRRINQLNNHISIMSKWKHSYDIRDVRSRKMFNFVNHEFEETEPYPSNAMEEEFELIRREIKLMQALESDIREMGDIDGTTKVWLEEMCKIAKDAKKLILSYYKNSKKLTSKYKYAIATEDAEKLISSYDKNSKKLTSEIKYAIETSLNNFCYPFRLVTRDVDRINDRITTLCERRVEYGIGHRKRLPPYIVSDLKLKLLEHHEHPCVIPILGMRHTHKEALKEFLNNEKAITSHFDCYAWVCVSEELGVTSILRDMVKQIIELQIAECLEEEPRRVMLEASMMVERINEEELIQMLPNVLLHKRFLVVLDGILSIEIWNFLKQAFRNTSTGSRTVLVTHEHTYFSLKSNSNGVSDSTEIRQMEDFQVGCEELCLLAPVKLTEIQSEIRDENTDEPSVPSYLKQCLYYFLLFPAKFEVPVRRLIVLWVAEGLVRARKNSNEAVELTAESYLTKLINLKMVQVTKRKLNGKVKACRLDDGKRGLWLEKAREARFFLDTTTEKITRLVDCHGGNDSCFIKIHGNPNSSTSLPKYKDVLSFLSFDSREGGKPGEDIGNFLCKCITARCFLGLRVLDLERVFRPKLAKELGLLTGLRYLGFRWTYLENLPTYINLLLNLQVLDVKHTYISILPRSIWSMQYLRHLYLSETFRTRFVGRPSKISLTNLQTLWGAYIDEDTAVKHGLDTLRSIRKLGLTCRSSSSQSSKMSEQLKAVDKWIAELKFLESLRLKSRDESGNPSDLHLNPLSSHRHLSTVYLLGKLLPSVVSEFPKNLTDITLSGSELGEDPMKSLGKLQNLLILRLLAKSVLCKEMHCLPESFPQLKVLSLWKLEFLEKWEVEEGALPALEDLEIRSCKKLKMLPESLKHIVSRKSFKLTNMPEEFLDEMKVKQTEIWSLFLKLKLS